MDDKAVKELISLLDQETRVYEDILKISENKTDIIVGGKVAELESIVKLEQSLIVQLGRLEDAREKVVSGLAAELGMAPADMTISSLSCKVDEKQASDLKDAQEKMAGMLGQLKNKNELNARLIKNSLDFIEFSINVLTGVGTPGDTYINSGQTGDAKKRSFFDVKL